MHVKSYRAKSMQQALDMVRRDLGPDASVLHTSEGQTRRMLGLLPGSRYIEVTASDEVQVPSRLPARQAAPRPAAVSVASEMRLKAPPAEAISSLELDQMPGRGGNDEFQSQLARLQEKVERLASRPGHADRHELPESLFHLFTDLIESEVSEELARELVERIRLETRGAEVNDPVILQAKASRMIEDEIRTAGPINVASGSSKLVALVGPTGVGKTTTIAKLAAIYRLKHKLKVGLITVDTYRIAAVDQLRTYADIIDLPMEVVSTPREMREAVARMGELDLVLMDTAGRSPRDEVKIQELKSFLSEADADEVHLVLSSTASAKSLCSTAQQFAQVGTSRILLTKLDEAHGLGNLLPLLRSSRLPLSYVTNGQDVPDDIEVGESRSLARAVLGMDS
jgi:flagellar biosynthesis protein FlhF